MSFEEFRQRADRVRQTPLEAVLACRGATPDRYDQAKWHTEQGPVSVSGQKFVSWHRSVGGGGAIDLVMHLAAIDFSTAVLWLEDHFGTAASDEGRLRESRGSWQGRAMNTGQASGYPSGEGLPVANGEPHPLRLPPRDRGQLKRVRRYLVERRCLRAAWLEPLIASGKLYADRRGNAVFLLLGKAGQPVGAELRGTSARAWRGMAPGSRKDLGCFWIGAADAKAIVLCESAIDAISCWGLFPDRIAISTSGARSNPAWLRTLIRRGYAIYCGFDADATGDEMAAAMITLHPHVRRLRPPAHDWNDVLTSRR